MPLSVQQFIDNLSQTGNERIRRFTIFTSRRQAQEATSKLEQLRNNLAHAQDILATDWGTILQLCEFITRQ